MSDWSKYGNEVCSMNITQLKYVLEVADSSSMRDASTKLYVSQPAPSSSIRELEDEIGIIIFERTNKGITLTDDGREFLAYAKKSGRTVRDPGRSLSIPRQR